MLPCIPSGWEQSTVASAVDGWCLLLQDGSAGSATKRASFPRIGLSAGAAARQHGLLRLKLPQPRLASLSAALITRRAHAAGPQRGCLARRADCRRALHLLRPMESPIERTASAEDDVLRPSFDELPIELRLNCLAGCDWQTLARAACVSRSVRALVRRDRGCGPAREVAGARGSGAGLQPASHRISPTLPPPAGGLPGALALLAVARGGAASGAVHRVCHHRGAGGSVHQVGGTWRGAHLSGACCRACRCRACRIFSVGPDIVCVAADDADRTD